MKYLSLIAFAALLGVSWFYFNQQSGLTADQQTRLQLVLEEYLNAYHAEANPNASDLQHTEITLKIIEPKKSMEAKFSFQYMSPNESGGEDSIEREGKFILTSENGNDWNASLNSINQSGVEVSEPFTISRTALSPEEIEKELGEKAPAPEPTNDH